MGGRVSDEADFSTIVVGDFVAEWIPVPYVSNDLSGRRCVLVAPQWVITTSGGRFVGLADSREQVQKLIRFAQQLPRAA
jgi:hypothetical protein